MAPAPRTPGRLILASASPARLKALRAAGLHAEVIVSGVDESAVTDGGPEVVSGTLARLKAEAVAQRLAAGEVASGDQVASDDQVFVLGCDSVLEFGGSVMGKPVDAADALQRWRLMRGGTGILHTGHCLVETASGRRAEGVASTAVSFADVTDGEIAAYVATGEPLNVAGAFTIDGLGGVFVERIDGDAGTVIGLSLPLLRRLLRSLGVEITAFWTPGSTATT